MKSLNITSGSLMHNRAKYNNDLNKMHKIDGVRNIGVLVNLSGVNFLKSTIIYVLVQILIFPLKKV